jgi:hypothetical protein
MALTLQGPAMTRAATEQLERTNEPSTGGQRDQIAERLAAVDQAEAALARVRDVFGMADAFSERPGGSRTRDRRFRALLARISQNRTRDEGFERDWRGAGGG